jgi:hypothetical protein
MYVGVNVDSTLLFVSANVDSTLVVYKCERRQYLDAVHTCEHRQYYPNPVRKCGRR